MKLCLIFRKKQTIFFSIEKVFYLIRPFWENTLEVSDLSLPYYTNGIISILKNILFIRRDRKADVYHITGDVHYAVFGAPRTKIVLTIHDCIFLYNYSGLKRKIIKWLLLDGPVRRATLITTISENSRQEIIRFTKCDPDKIVVIPNPVNSNMYHKVRVFDPANPAILFIGSTPNKNLERAIDAIKGISCQLIIIGKINDTQQKLLADSSVSYRVLSGLSEQQMADMYAESDIVLFPSTYEGFGLPIIEGQKAGRVIITSNIDPMRQVAGKGALLVNPLDVMEIRNAVIKAIHEPETRESLIREGFQNIDRYEAGSIARQYQEVYSRISGRKSSNNS